MSRTRKDSLQQGTIIELVRRDDGTFDLFLNRDLNREHIYEHGLSEELCVRFGYCGEEYEAILQELNQNGKATVRL
jgi:hypothetical protein